MPDGRRDLIDCHRRMECRGGRNSSSLAPVFKKSVQYCHLSGPHGPLFKCETVYSIFCALNALRRRHLHAHQLMIHYDFQVPDGNFILDVAIQLGFQER